MRRRPTTIQQYMAEQALRRAGNAVQHARMCALSSVLYYDILARRYRWWVSDELGVSGNGAGR